VEREWKIEDRRSKNKEAVSKQKETALFLSII
jgi:hypothetical protein